MIGSFRSSHGRVSHFLQQIVSTNVPMVVWLCYAALMQDQVSNFNKRGISSEFYCSTRTVKEREVLVRRLQSPNLDLRLLFVTPESFGSDQ